MKADDIRRWLPVAVMTVLVGAALVLALHRGPAWGPLAAAVVAALLLSFIVRHRIRTMRMDERDDSRTDTGRSRTGTR